MRWIASLMVTLSLACVTGCGDAPLEEGSPSAPPATSASTDSRVSQVQEDVRQMWNYLEQGEAGALFDMMHPKYLDTLENRAEAEELMRARAKAIFAPGSQAGISEPDFYKEPDFVEVGDTIFAIIPYKITMSDKESHQEMTTFHVGVLETGSSSWKYLGHEENASEQLPKLFPQFPADYQFPEMKMTEL